MTFKTPIRDMRFILDHAAGFGALEKSGAFPELSGDLVDAILEEMGKFCDGVIAPLNEESDRNGAKLENGVVRTTPGFKEAYKQYVDGGWSSLAFPEAAGGQGLPATLAVALVDALNGACMSFAIGTTLTTGAVKAILHAATEEQRRLYLEKMVTGEWTGTMNLTEPSAGSDLAAVSTKAVPQDDGTYKISGQKIFITFGEHDMTDNIIHLVLARTPDAPAGSRGISLFIVPKFLVNEDGSLGERNPAFCISLEHKMGIHGSPTATMSFEEATGYLVKAENKGLACMFTMMNNARLNVGNEGYAAAERAYQAAREYARDRIQSPLLGSKDKTSVSIDKHPDVRRMLLTMKSKTEAARAISYFAARQQDFFVKAENEEDRATADRKPVEDQPLHHRDRAHRQRPALPGRSRRA